MSLSLAVLGLRRWLWLCEAHVIPVTTFPTGSPDPDTEERLPRRQCGIEQGRCLMAAGGWFKKAAPVGLVGDAIWLPVWNARDVDDRARN